MSLAYAGVGEGPVETVELPGMGSLQGEYKSRDVWLFQVGLSWGSL
jgi:hypothetical protein